MSEQRRDRNAICVSDIFTGKDNRVWSRKRLAQTLGTTDRKMRMQIQAARREGIPIMALPEGGYKLAETPDEKRQLLHMHLGRALDLLKTYRALKESMTDERQITIDEALITEATERAYNDLLCD